MQNENSFIHILTRQYLRIRSCIIHLTYRETRTKRLYIQLLLICLIISTIYFLVNPSASINQKSPSVSTQVLAYIITDDCNSLRFHTTKKNIERAFPNFFNIICRRYVSHNDSRIHPVPLSILKKMSSNLLTFVDLWAYIIPNGTKNDDEWAFIFEDDVYFNDPSKVSLPNYIALLEEFLNKKEIQEDGFFFLGICDPVFINNTKTLISKNTNDQLLSRKACGICLHASGVIPRRSKLIWGDLASYRPNIDESVDKIMRDYCNRGQISYYTLGTNFISPVQSSHYGIAYQDRGKP